MHRCARAILAACAVLGGAETARAEPVTSHAEPASKKAILLPTLVGQPGNLHKATDKEAELRALAATVDAQIADAAQDLGLMVDVGQAPSPELGRASEGELASRASELGAVVFAPSLRVEDGVVQLRLAAFDPSGHATFVRTARTTRAEAGLHAVVLLRDLTRDLGGRGAAPARAAAIAAVEPKLPPATRSAGRATLLVNATLFGGLTGFSVQKASGSNDPRILYPLLAVGAGVGLGGAIIITEEWDVTGSDAWYLASGMWWPSLAGQFIYAGRFANLPEGDRWEFGLIGGTMGLAMASLGVALKPMSEGGAWLAHSGGALGVVFGGLGEFMGRGSIHTTPFGGMGYGAGIGWLAAAAAATQLHLTPSQVLALDVGSLVGGLGGAALGSPLVFGKQDATKQRAWVGITGGASIAGATTAYLLFGRDKAMPKAAWLLPEPGLVGETGVGLSLRARLDADGTPHSIR